MKKKQTIKQFFKTFWSLYKTSEVELTSLSVAYYLLISALPLLLTLANLLPYLKIDIDQVLVWLRDFFPTRLYPTAANLVTILLTRPSSSVLGLSLLSMLWTMSKSMTILQQAFNKAYGVEEHRDIIIGRLVGLFLGVGLQLIVMLGVAMVTFGRTTFRLLEGWFPVVAEVDMTWLPKTELLSYVLLFLALVMLYFFLPNVRIRKLAYALPGTIFVLVVMTTVSKFFVFYVESYANRFLDFRLLTVLVLLVLMLWCVFVSRVLIMGALLNAVIQVQREGEVEVRQGDIVSIFRHVQGFIGKRIKKQNR